MSLEDARARLAESSLGMLSAVKRRQRTQKLLQNLTIIATLVRLELQHWIFLKVESEEKLIVFSAKDRCSVTRAFGRNGLLFSNTTFGITLEF